MEYKAKKVFLKDKDGNYLIPFTNTGSGLVMFDTILKDHVLTYEESKGLALQGTYVYKDAVAGSRYGYADFYNKCLEEYKDSSNTKQYLKSNVTTVGSLTDNQGVLSGFSSSKYATIPNVTIGSANTWEQVWKVTTGSAVSSSYYINCGNGVTYCDFGIAGGVWKLFLSSNGSSWNIVNGATNNISAIANTTYLVKVEFTGSVYNMYVSTNNGDSWTTVATHTSSTKVYPVSSFRIGVTNDKLWVWNGSIDLNESYININGERWWTGIETVTKNPNGHVFYDISQKDQIDELFNSTGMAWMYGIDQENERIFLPRNNYFEQITGDVLDVGQSVEAGLPNITGRAYGDEFPDEMYAEGAFYNGGEFSNTAYGSQAPSKILGFDASRSNSIYGNSDTVQPNAVKKLLYICVGNTESQSAVTNVVDATTTENDTLPLLHHIPADELLEHPSWLRSAGQWNDGNVYTTAYNYLVNEYMYGSDHTDTLKASDGTEYTVTYRTVKGKKVVDVANVAQVDVIYLAMGSAWYYVINQDDMTFRLPMSHNSECYTSDPTRVGLDVSAGLPNIEGSFYPRNVNYGTYWNDDSYEGGALYKLSLEGDTTRQALATESNYSDSVALGFDASRSNSIYGNSDTVTPPHTEFYLYFKVANAVQNLELLNAGEVLEAVNNVVPNNRTVWDGQWVYPPKTASYLTWATSGIKTIDLSRILPNDGYNYECLFGISFYATNQLNVYIGTDLVPVTTDAPGWVYNQGSGKGNTGTIILAVGSGRYVQVNASAAPTGGIFHFAMLGYRRLGTNT